jgi:hypothetical protein
MQAYANDFSSTNSSAVAISFARENSSIDNPAKTILPQINSFTELLLLFICLSIFNWNAPGFKLSQDATKTNANLSKYPSSYFTGQNIL